MWEGFSCFPAVDREEGYAKLFGELTLSEPEGFPHATHPEPHLQLAG